MSTGDAMSPERSAVANRAAKGRGDFLLMVYGYPFRLSTLDSQLLTVIYACSCTGASLSARGEITSCDFWPFQQVETQGVKGLRVACELFFCNAVGERF